MSEKFAAVEIISAKRDKIELSDDQIDWAVDAYTRGVIADEQMSALLMAILLNGMNNREISRWTDAMVASGEKMNWSMLDRPTVDKHSTGGVGDKITLPLAPWQIELNHRCAKLEYFGQISPYLLASHESQHQRPVAAPHLAFVDQHLGAMQLRQPSLHLKLIIFQRC